VSRPRLSASGDSTGRASRIALVPILRVLLLVAPWAFIAYLFRDVDAAVNAFRDASPAPMIAALLLMMLVLVVMAWLWTRLISHFSRELGAADRVLLLKAFARSWLARYLPGKLWAYGARVIHTESSGVPTRLVASGLVAETALVVGTTTALGLGLWLWSIAGPAAGLTVLAIAWLALVLAVSRLGWLTALALRLLSNILSRRWEDTARRLQEDDPSLNLGASAAFAGGYLLNNLIGAVAFVFVVLSLGDLDWGDLPLVMGGYSLAAVIGIVAIFAPAGLGVREAVLAGFLTPVVASPVAVSIAFLIRALTVLADVLFLGSVEIVALAARGQRKDRAAGDAGPEPVPTPSNRPPA